MLRDRSRACLSSCFSTYDMNFPDTPPPTKIENNEVHLLIFTLSSPLFPNEDHMKLRREATAIAYVSWVLLPPAFISSPLGR